MTEDSGSDKFNFDNLIDFSEIDLNKFVPKVSKKQKKYWKMSNSSSQNNAKGKKDSKIKENNFLKTQIGGFGIGSSNENLSNNSMNIGHNGNMNINSSISNSMPLTSKFSHGPIILPK